MREHKLNNESIWIESFLSDQGFPWENEMNILEGKGSEHYGFYLFQRESKFIITLAISDPGNAFYIIYTPFSGKTNTKLTFEVLATTRKISRIEAKEIWISQYDVLISECEHDWL